MPRKMVGSALSGRDVKNLVSSSYEKKGKKKIGDNVLDESLSNKKVKVYNNPKTGKTTVVNRGTIGTVSDWANNAVYAIQGKKAYKKTDRYKQAKKTQEKVVAKYGKENVTNVGHSQGGLIARELNKEGLTNEVIAVNPASKGEKVKKNETVIKSSGDLVSVLVPKGKNVKVSKAKGYNPLRQHSAKIIRGADNEKMFGGCRNCGCPCGDDEELLSVLLKPRMIGGAIGMAKPRVVSDIVSSDGVPVGGYMSGGSLRLTREFFPAPRRYDLVVSKYNHNIFFLFQLIYIYDLILYTQNP
jgi:hypothetical protein